MMSRRSRMPPCQGADTAGMAAAAGVGVLGALGALGAAGGRGSGSLPASAPRSSGDCWLQERISACSRGTRTSGVPEPVNTWSRASFFFAAVRPAWWVSSWASMSRIRLAHCGCSPVLARNSVIAVVTLSQLPLATAASNCRANLFCSELARGRLAWSALNSRSGNGEDGGMPATSKYRLR